MSTSTALPSGLEALEQGRYEEAVELLEEFCQSAPVDDEYLHAQMSLVTAYHYTNQTEKAIALCQQLLANDNSEVQTWAQEAISSLQPQSLSTAVSQEEHTRELIVPVDSDSVIPEEASEAVPTNVEAIVSAVEEDALERAIPIYTDGELTPEQAEELLNAGSKALKKEYYAEAVQALTTYCQKADSTVKAYGQAQMWLVKAYKGNEQIEDAIALCYELTTSDKPMVQAWAKQFLGTIAAADVIQAVVAPTSATEGNVTNNVPLPKRTIQEFKNFCQDNLLGELKALEAKRKQVLVNIIVATIIVIALVLLITRCFPYAVLDFSSVRVARVSFFLLSLFILSIIGCMWGWVVFYSSSTEAYASGFKAKFIQKIIDFIDTNQTFNYSHNEDKHMSLLAFRHSKLFQGLLAPTKITQSDCVSAQIGETDIFFSEICTQGEIHHGWVKYLDLIQNPRLMMNRFTGIFLMPLFILSLVIKLVKGIPYVSIRVIRGQRIDYRHFEEEVMQNQVSRKKIFKGLFFRANFNKNFKGRTIVLPSDLSSKMRVLTQGREAVVKLEDPEFAKLFVVYGDQIEARFILSTNLIEKVVNFRKKAGRKVYISFAESKIYVAIEYEEDIFEPRLFKTMLKFTPMREYYESLQLMLGIVEDLNLNRRIWS